MGCYSDTSHAVNKIYKFESKDDCCDYLAPPGSELIGRTIYPHNKRISDEQLIAAAKDEKHPLHKYIWEDEDARHEEDYKPRIETDKEAANKWRLQKLEDVKKQLKTTRLDISINGDYYMSDNFSSWLEHSLEKEVFEHWDDEGKKVLLTYEVVENCGGSGGAKNIRLVATVSEEKKKSKKKKK